MSINMEKSLKDFLEKNPEEVVNKDELGYTMLHREAVAGNKTCVDVLLQLGADRTVTTKGGHTALDLARKMEWDHLLGILS